MKTLEHCAAILAALHFAAEKHRDQRRKGQCASPYINHPIEVAELLVRVGQVGDVALLQAALLHDTVEDTQTTFQELEERFGTGVRTLVEEVTDDKSLPKEERKRRQVERAPTCRREPARSSWRTRPATCETSSPNLPWTGPSSGASPILIGPSRSFPDVAARTHASSGNSRRR